MKNEKILTGVIHLNKLMGLQVKVYHHLGVDALDHEQGRSVYYQAVNHHGLNVNTSDIIEGAKVTFRVEKPLDKKYDEYFFGASQTRDRCTILTIESKGKIVKTDDNKWNYKRKNFTLVETLAASH